MAKEEERICRTLFRFFISWTLLKRTIIKGKVMNEDSVYAYLARHPRPLRSLLQQ